MNIAELEKALNEIRKELEALEDKGNTEEVAKKVKKLHKKIKKKEKENTSNTEETKVKRKVKKSLFEEPKKKIKKKQKTEGPKSEERKVSNEEEVETRNPTKSKKIKQDAEKSYTLNDLAEELGINLPNLRNYLKAVDAEKPGTRWVWPKRTDPALKQIRVALKAKIKEIEKKKRK